MSITTIHSAMNDQPVIDAYHHEDLRRTRSAFQSVIPVSTGLARGIERLLPELAGRIQAKAIRVPTVNVSALDITLRDFPRHLRRRDQPGASRGHRKRPAARTCWLIPSCRTPSCDFNHDPHSAIVDGSQTRVSGLRPGQSAGLVRQQMRIRQPYARRRRTLPARRRADQQVPKD
ncbi:hypothetical protein P4123_20020 [Pseudomonas aeruginosa]|nr:hypothetical protein [Pseudomonas aeruginosa]